MNLLSIENLAKSFGERTLFQNVTFGIAEGDRIGLIGVNGTGKSTFLKIIAGLATPDSGRIIKGNGVQIEYLAQIPDFDGQATVLEQVFKGNSTIMQVIREYEQAVDKAHKEPDNVLWQRKLIALSQRMDAGQAWQLESDARAILNKLGISDFTAVINTLSGGQRKRVALAGALINPADLLILDEPTNHIDNATVAWLEQYLGKHKGALLMITHDRYFLDRVANRIIELDKGILYTYSGNYSTFLEMKSEREEQQEAGERKRQNLLRKELAWIKRGAKARSTKQKARIERFARLAAEKTEPGEEKLQITAGSSRLGRKIIELEHITQSFGGTVLIKDFSYNLQKNDRVGIVGPNGSGKTTLLNIMAGKLIPDTGRVEIGQTVKIGYFSQESSEMDDNVRVIDYIKEEAHMIPCAGGTISAAQMLERFLFPPVLQWIPVAKLSGGEKRRLSLLKILMSAPNILLLDEPTNDLDTQTLTILEEYFDDFPGAIIAVSHDRYFLDRVAEKIFALEGEGIIRQYTGGYSDYQEKAMLSGVNAREKSKGVMDKPAALKSVKEQPRKFTFKEQREYEQIEDIIAGVEGEMQEVVAAINTAGSDYQLLQELTGVQQQLAQRLDALMERWAYLNNLAAEMAKKGCRG